MAAAAGGNRRPDDPVTVLPGIGDALAVRLGQLGVATLADLLFHLPNRYEDRTRVYPLGELEPGLRAQVIARVERADIRFGRRRSLLVSLTDGTGRIGMRLFHFSRAQSRQLQPGVWVRLFGDVRPGPRGLEMAHPEYRIVADRETAEADTADTLTPLYPLTAGITQARLRGLIDRALDGVLAAVPDPLGAVPGMELPTLHQALRTLHRPPVDIDVSLLAGGYHPAQRRLAAEELLAHHLSLTDLKARTRESLRAAPIALTDTIRQRLFDALGFAPTGAQRRVVDELAGDLDREQPMMRLVQGDVGAGKTVIAAAALQAAVEAGYQSALMAPTELLAEQHAATLAAWLTPLGTEVVLLSGTLSAAARRKALDRLASGGPLIAVGTHALFQRGVALPGLALVVVDEQHRFGVHQRLTLLDKGDRDARYPHQLVMTATPIPRTLAMRAYADLDTSVLDELPPGRTPVTTVAVDQARRDDVIARVAAACADGRQVYWVCTLVEASDEVDAEAAEAAAARLRTECPDLRIGLVHGRLKPADKQAVMASFKAGEVDLLVATTVIEVGVDVPNASVMVIENPERLGLAQLHQLRGRVGRGARASHCVLLYQAPLSDLARARLAVMRETTDGFAIAERDLALRGPGEVMGVRQTGEVGLRIADMVRDADLLDPVQALADGLGGRRPAVRDALVRRWIAGGEDYARA